jgi:hypothetical protein
MVAVSLWHESSHYHVRATHDDNPNQVGFIEWKGGLETLTEARKVFRGMVRKYTPCRITHAHAR